MALSNIIKPRLCELGKIKIGGKEAKARTSGSGTEWRAPTKLDHFLITGVHRDPAGNLMQDAALMESLAKDFADKDGKIRRLPIYVLSHDIEDIVQASYCWYGGRNIAARSNGETVTWFVDQKTGKRLDEPLVEPWRDDFLQLTDSTQYHNRLFKIHTIFNCVIAHQSSRWGGVYKFRTTSQISSSQLVGSLMNIQQLTGGILRGLPLQLTVRPMQVSPEGKTTNVYVVHVELLGADLTKIQAMALDRLRFEAENKQQISTLQAQYKSLLVAPGENETPDDAADVHDEFHPESNGDDTARDNRIAAALGDVPAEDVPQLGPPDEPSVQVEPTEPTWIAECSARLDAATTMPEYVVVGRDISAAWKALTDDQITQNKTALTALVAKQKARKSELSKQPDDKQKIMDQLLTDYGTETVRAKMLALKLATLDDMTLDQLNKLGVELAKGG